MEIRSYLFFSLHGLPYAIAAERVQEIFLLPELTPVADAPPDIVGLIDFHGRIVPIMHLDLRFGHAVEQCHVTDSVIVLESQGLQVGVIVHQVDTVNEIDSRYIQADLTYGRERDINTAFVEGVIQLDEETIPLLNVDNLLRYQNEVKTLVENEDSSTLEAITPQPQGSFYDLYYPQATAKAKAILRQRAASLKLAIADSELTELKAIAVFSLDGDYFGCELHLVKEFTKIERITTIPCCPNHIIGNMNLRGEILTLVDIRQALGLAIKTRQQATKAVVIDVDEIVTGIAVDEVFDVVYLHPDEIKSVPVALNPQTAEYLQGMATYQDRPLNLVDLSKLLTQGALTVELAA